MYTTHFGFNEKPFALTPNPRFIYLSHNHKEAFAHLLYGINNRHGFMCLSGEVGTGKTTLLRALLGRLQDRHHRTALIFNPSMTGVELLQSINQDYGINSGSDHASELLNTLNHFLLSENSQGRTVVLVIDEAQNLPPDVLEQVRLISNLETENDKLIQIILAGQTELRKLLKRPELRQLDQRIAVRYTLKPMTRAETGAYIRHRIETAGSDGSVSFSGCAAGLIHLYARGIPRTINILCDRALLDAYSHELQHITIGTVFKAIWELRELPTLGHAREYRPATVVKKRSRRLPFGRKPAPDGADTTAAVMNPAPPGKPGLSQAAPPAPVPGSPAPFDLGKELRQELNDERPLGAESDSDKGLSLLHSMTEELNNPDLPSDVLLLVLRFAAEFLNRAVVFMVHDATVSGAGQFGINGDTISGDEKVRAIMFSVDIDSMFRAPCRTARATTFKPEPTPVNRLIFDQLGGIIPDEVFIGPIVSRSRVIGFLYGDNLPENKRIGRTESLEIFLSQAGVALEKILLERRLQERGGR